MVVARGNPRYHPSEASPGARKRATGMSTKRSVIPLAPADWRPEEREFHSTNAGYALTMVGVHDNDPVVCVDCLRCNAMICEATPAAFTDDPTWLAAQLTGHELTHGTTTP